MSRAQPLGAIVGARSGDKGGDANVGVWVPDPVESLAVRLSHGEQAALEVGQAAVDLADARFAWLCDFLTVDRFKDLLPETASLTVERYVLGNLRALNFVIHGLLGRGVADSTRSDPQAKGLAEHLRARLVEVPDRLSPGEDTARTP